MRYESQAVARRYFVLAGLLFGLQVLAGLLIAAQYVWPSLLADAVPFNLGRTLHVNLLVVWLLMGIMGATYYVVPEEAETDIHSTRLASFQFWLLALTGVTAVVGYFFGWTEGREYIEAPRPLDWAIVAGALIFLYNILMTILKGKKKTAILGVMFAGLAGLAVMYLFGVKFFPNLSTDQFFWWWVIHLWVEGTWELVTAGLMAFLLIKLTGVDRRVVEKWLYVEIALVLATGILGTGHHYYWIGTPRYWLIIGGIFSFLEIVPLVLMVAETLHRVGLRNIVHPNRLALYWTVGSAITHFVGAGVLGAVQTLPQINKWTHGTQLTASHGHLAFFGAFAMTVIAVIYYAVPEMRGLKNYPQRLGMWAFWTMLLSMVAMSMVLFGAGITQVYLERILGMNFSVVKSQYLTFWMFWRWVTGLFFAAGAVAFIWDYLGLSLGAALPATGRVAAEQPAASSPGS